MKETRGFHSSVFFRPRRELACNEAVIPAWSGSRGPVRRALCQRSSDWRPDSPFSLWELRLDPCGSTKSSEVKQMLMLIQIVAGNMETSVAGKFLWMLNF